MIIKLYNATIPHLTVYLDKKITTRLHKVGTSPPEGKGGGGGDAHLICNHVMISPAAGLGIV